jgi:hypothetical protein
MLSHQKSMGFKKLAGNGFANGAHGVSQDRTSGKPFNG